MGQTYSVFRGHIQKNTFSTSVLFFHTNFMSWCNIALSQFIVRKFLCWIIKLWNFNEGWLYSCI